MRHRVLVGIALSLGAIALAFASRDRPAALSSHSVAPDRIVPVRPRPPAGPLEWLNDVIQERLHTADGAGMARLPTTPEHLKEFPSYSSIDEVWNQRRAAVNQLRREGWTVALYLAGRAVLDPPMSEAEWDRLEESTGTARYHASPPRTIGRPLLISGRVASEELPKPRDLWEIGQRALRASATSDRYETTFGPWSVDARPVRADRQSCLNCHQSDEDARAKREGSGKTLAIGDALGVVMYVYRRPM